MFTTPPFRQAPWLLFRRPVVLAAIGGTAIILGLVASLTPMFGSSAASAALQDELEGRCRSNFAAKMPAFGSPGPTLSEGLEKTREVLRSATGDDPAFEDPTLILRGLTVDATRAGGGEGTSEVQIIGLEDFADNLVLVAGAPGEGAYIDQRTAETLGAGPGDELLLSAAFFTDEGQQEFTTQVSVTAVFDDLNDDYLDPYWCVFEDALAPSPFGDPPPAPLLVDTSVFRDDPDTFYTIYGIGHEPGVWHIPVRVDGLTVSGARNAVDTIEATNASLTARLNDAFGGPVSSAFGAELESDLFPVVARVAAQIDALDSSIFPLATVVLLAGIGLIGAAGSYWVERRRAELELLSAVGVPPWGIGLKAGLELMLPVLLGATAGSAVGNALIGVVGPSSDIEMYARWEGFGVTLASVGVGVVTAASVAGVRARSLLDRKPNRSEELNLRWPLIVLSGFAAYLVRSEIGDQAVTVGENVVVGSVDPLVLLFPVLVLILAVLLVSELVTVSRSMISRWGERTHSGYIASRRVLSAPSVALALLAGAAIPIAILIYSANLARSATVSIEAKGKTSIGSDVSTLIYRVEDLPPVLEAASTIVIKFERVRLNGEVVDVLAVDPASFAKGGFWLESYADRPLSQVLSQLASPTEDSVLAAVIANAEANSGVVELDAGDVEIEVVASVDEFPGSVRDRPLIIVDRTVLEGLLAGGEDRIRGGRYLMWSSGLSETEIDDALTEADVGFAFTTAADTTLDQLKFAVIVWTFEFLRLYAAMAGLIVIASVLIYTDTRQRTRNLSYALARRMGLTRRDHMIAGILEVGSLSLLGTLAGVGVGVWTSRNLYLALDPLPETPPVPQWVGATDLTLVVVVVVVVVTVMSAWLAQRTAENSNVSELLRHGD